MTRKKKKQLRWLTIKASHLLPALKRARKLTDEWQAECLEVALVPAVYRRLVAINEEAGRIPHLKRHPGLPHIHFTREQNEQICSEKGWEKYAGWTLRVGDYGVWNRPTDTYYAHSAGTAWNGCQRELACLSVEHLRGALVSLERGNTHIDGYLDALAERHVRLVDDISDRAKQRGPEHAEEAQCLPLFGPG